MAYQVVSIGRVFNEKSRQALIDQMNHWENHGWDYHSVFAVSERTGCLGTNTAETLYMVMKYTGGAGSSGAGEPERD